MMRSLLLLILLTSSLWGCKSLHPVDAPAGAPSTSVHDNVISERYTPDAVSILPDGTVLQNAEKIMARWQTITTGVPPGKISKAIIGTRENEYDYTITTLLTADDRRYAELAVWDQRDSLPRRALEFIAPYESALPDLAEIDAARARWMQYCNAHEVEQLIENCYTENTLYYNHRPLLRGRTALIPEYAYMKKPAYQLTLTPIDVEPVSSKLVLELGQCSGSYGGKYLLVWERQEDGQWQVLLDGNL